MHSIPTKKCFIFYSLPQNPSEIKKGYSRDLSYTTQHNKIYVKLKVYYLSIRYRLRNRILPLVQLGFHLECIVQRVLW